MILCILIYNLNDIVILIVNYISDFNWGFVIKFKQKIINLYLIFFLVL